jgi:hypothetical protein
MEDLALEKPVMGVNYGNKGEAIVDVWQNEIRCTG